MRIEATYHTYPVDEKFGTVNKVFKCTFRVFDDNGNEITDVEQLNKINK